MSGRVSGPSPCGRQIPFGRALLPVAPQRIGNHIGNVVAQNASLVLGVRCVHGALPNLFMEPIPIIRTK